MTQGDALTTRIIRDEVEWDAIRSDWDSLHASCPSASTPLDFHWLRSWWAEYGAAYGAGGLQMVTLWRGGLLVGGLPLYVREQSARRLWVRSLRFISTGESEHEETCPEHLGLLSRPGEERACAEAAWGAIGRLDWDECELLDLDAGSPLTALATLPSRAKSFSRGSCPVADLTGGFEAYVGRLSAHGRKRARHLIRAGDLADVTFEVAGALDAVELFDDLVRLHQQRWESRSKPGAFAAPRFVAFHRRLVHVWASSGRAVLARLAFGGAPAVVLYGFINQRTFDFYQMGMRPDASDLVQSPGHLALLLLMKWLSERGVTTFDFLRGSASYKERLASREIALTGIRVRRPTLRSAAYQSLRLAARIARGRAGLRRDVPA